jgi:Methylamine utilisation protein MauE
MGPVGPALALGCRIVLGVVLVVAAVAKIANRRAVPGQLRAMGIAPPWLSAGLAVALPVVELGVAAALVAVPHSSVPAVVALVLLLGFTIVLLASAKRAVPCPCFGAVRSERAASVPGAVMRNGLLIALAVLATGSVAGARAGATLVVAAIGCAASALVVTRVA